MISSNSYPFIPVHTRFIPDRQHITDMHIPMNNGSILRLKMTDKIAVTGERIIDARIARGDILFPSHNAHVRGINTTEALNVIDRKPKSLIVCEGIMPAIIEAIASMIIIVSLEKNNLCL